jgi:anti-sigma regulatory factor (Ser/Thr protein kinase)
MNVQLSLDMPGTANYISFARSVGQELMREMKIVPSDIFDVSCVVTELVTNSVRHAHVIDGRIQLQIDCNADRVIVTVTDSGEGFSLTEFLEPGSSRFDVDLSDRIGGFGIPLVKALTSKMNFTRLKPTGMVVSAEVHLTGFQPVLVAAA